MDDWRRQNPTTVPNLIRLSLSAAERHGADLTDARLDGTNLTNTDLSRGLLKRTDFASAKLAGARPRVWLSARNLTQDQAHEP